VAVLLVALALVVSVLQAVVLLLAVQIFVG
jgi:hypothetical protein